MHAQIFTRSYIRRSRSRYRAVHRRQMDALLRRTAWFLQDTSTDPSTITPPAPHVVVTFEPPSTSLPTSYVTAFSPTSTQSLVDIGRSRQHSYTSTSSHDPGEVLPVTVTSGDGMETYYLTAMPTVSMTSIRSAPTCQVSPAISGRTGYEEEEGGDRGDIE